MMSSFPDMSRRTFRGRAGPTDGRLRKYQARKRRQPETTTKTEKKNNTYDASDDNSEILILEDEEDELMIIVNDEEYLSRQKGGVNESIPDGEEIKAENVNNNPLLSERTRRKNEEIKHLLKRIGNISKSITLSGSAISNPTTWVNNVLNAVENTVGEWRAILCHYDIDDIEAKDPSLAIFMLIQQSMQSGPLTGSNPGYFKRCGATVAKQALIFLQEIIPAAADADLLRLSEKQSMKVEKWKSDAVAAIEKNKPTSKSQLKKQQQSGKKKKKRK